VPEHDTVPIKAAVHVFTIKSFAENVQGPCLEEVCAAGTVGIKDNLVVRAFLWVCTAAAVIVTLLSSVAIRITLARFGACKVGLLPGVSTEFKPTSMKRVNKNEQHAHCSNN
jgi:hypothetical protein